MMASRSPSPSASEGSWEEVCFPELEEDSPSDDGLVVLGTKSRPGQRGKKSARSRTRSPADALAAQEKVKPETPKTETGSRTTFVGESTAARILQAWWRTRKVPAVHLPDADEDDEVMSEELDEEEDQEDHQVLLTDGYKSCKELLPQWIQQREAAEDEPGEEPEAEAEACSSKVQSPIMAPAEAPEGLEDGTQMKRSAWSFIMGGALALSLVLALHGSGWFATSLPDATVEPWVARPASTQRPAGLEKSVFKSAGNRSAAEGTLELSPLEVLRQEVAAAREIATAALREAMEAQSSWLAEAKARREAEKAMETARWQLEQVREEAAYSVFQAALAVNRSQDSARYGHRLSSSARLADQLRRPKFVPDFEEEEDEDESLDEEGFDDEEEIEISATYDVEEELSRSRALWLPPFGRDLVVWPGLTQPALAELQMKERSSKSELLKFTKEATVQEDGNLADLTYEQPEPEAKPWSFLLEPPKMPQALESLEYVRSSWQNWRRQDLEIAQSKTSSDIPKASVESKPEPALQPLLLQQLELVQRMQRPLRLEPPKPKLPTPMETALPAKKHVDQQLSLMVWQQRRQLPQLLPQPTPSPPTELPLNWFRLKPALRKMEAAPEQPVEPRSNLAWQLPRMETLAPLRRTETSVFEVLPAAQQLEPEHEASLKSWRENHRRKQQRLWQEQQREEKKRQEKKDRERMKKGERAQRAAEKQRRKLMKQQWKAEKASWSETNFRAAAAEALAKSAETLTKQAEQFMVEAGSWATQAGKNAARKAEDARRHAKKMKHKAVQKALAAEEKARKELQKAQHKAQSIAEKARRKAEWTLEKGRQTAERKAKKATKYVVEQAEKLAGMSSSLLQARNYVHVWG